MGAQTGQTSEVLCLTTTTRLDPSPLTARDGVSIMNNGPYPVDIIITMATNPTIVLGHADRLSPKDKWGPYPLSDAIHIFGICSVNQVSGAACVLTEYGG